MPVVFVTPCANYIANEYRTVRTTKPIRENTDEL